MAHTGESETKCFDQDVEIFDGIVFELEYIFDLTRIFESFDNTESD